MPGKLEVRGSNQLGGVFYFEILTFTRAYR
jgi:hypothetical protein